MFKLLSEIPTESIATGEWRSSFSFVSVEQTIEYPLDWRVYVDKSLRKVAKDLCVTLAEQCMKQIFRLLSSQGLEQEELNTEQLAVLSQRLIGDASESGPAAWSMILALLSACVGRTQWKLLSWLLQLHNGRLTKKSLSNRIKLILIRLMNLHQLNVQSIPVAYLLFRFSI